MKELKDQNGPKFSKSLQLLKSEGDTQILKDLVRLLMQKEEAEGKQILSMLCDLNDTSATEEMIEILRDEEFLSVRQALLATVWNSKLNYSNYLPEFVEIASEGSFLEALDCLTILEGMEGPFEERHILEAQLFLKEYLEDASPKDPQKAAIMSEIALFLKDAGEVEDDDLGFYNS
ncbi:MAG: hypothetical protein RIT43_2463 [Bacteroidota bacterium]